MRCTTTRTKFLRSALLALGRPPHPATYSAKVAGDHMTLTVTVPDAGVTLGPFDLVRGGPPVTQMCV